MPHRAARLRLALSMLATAVMPACTPTAAPTGSDGPVTSLSIDAPVAGPTAHASASARPAPEPAGDCAIAPLAMVRVKQGASGPERETYLRLLPSGQILWGDKPDPKGASPMYQLRRPGCLYISGHLFAEYFGREGVWLRGIGRARPQGPAPSDGPVPASGFEDFELEGDAPGLACARTMLPILFFGTMRRDSPVAGPTALDPESRCAESVPWPEGG